jgi:hypothetical protein
MLTHHHRRRRTIRWRISDEASIDTAYGKRPAKRDPGSRTDLFDPLFPVVRSHAARKVIIKNSEAKEQSYSFFSFFHEVVVSP